MSSELKEFVEVTLVFYPKFKGTKNLFNDIL